MTASSILACTDGSSYAHSVYLHAAWAAKQMQSGVRVVHMLNPRHKDPLKADLSGSLGFNARQALLEELVELEAAKARVAAKRGEAILEDAEVQLRSAGITEIVKEQKHGALSEAITGSQNTSGLVVIGKRGNNADFEKGHLGTNLERVIRACENPVLVASREYQPIKKFLLAFDGGASSCKAVDFAAESSLLKGMDCCLLSAGKHSDGINDSIAQASQKLRSAGYNVAIHQVAGEPENVIESIVDEEDIDLLVMGAYGHSFVHRLLAGSTTTAMIRSVKRPVLLFR